MKYYNKDQIVEMFQKIDLSIGVFDRNLDMVYVNEKGNQFYEKMFGAKNLLGKNVAGCHEPIHVKNIEALFQQFEKGKPFSFISAEVPVFEGGHLSVLHMPLKENGKVIGIMEIPMETSFVPGSGYCEYERTYKDESAFLDFSHMDEN